MAKIISITLNPAIADSQQDSTKVIENVQSRKNKTDDAIAIVLDAIAGKTGASSSMSVKNMLKTVKPVAFASLSDDAARIEVLRANQENLLLIMADMAESMKQERKWIALIRKTLSFLLRDLKRAA